MSPEKKEFKLAVYNLDEARYLDAVEILREIVCRQSEPSYMTFREHIKDNLEIREITNEV